MDNVAILVYDVLPIVLIDSQDAELFEHLHEIIRKALQLLYASIGQNAIFLNVFIILDKIVQHFELFDEVDASHFFELFLITLIKLLVFDILEQIGNDRLSFFAIIL